MTDQERLIREQIDGWRQVIRTAELQIDRLAALIERGPRQVKLIRPDKERRES